jgi:hypothetical protein
MIGKPAVRGAIASHTIRSASPVERRDGTYELPIAAAEIPIDRTAHGAMTC